MQNVVLAPGQSAIFTDTEGGSDLVVTNASSGQGQYTLANDSDPPQPYVIAPGESDAYIVADGQSATVANTGAVPLGVAFGSGALGAG